MRAEERRTMIAPPTLSKRTHYPPGLSRDDTQHYNVELERVENRAVIVHSARTNAAGDRIPVDNDIRPFGDTW